MTDFYPITDGNFGWNYHAKPTGEFRPPLKGEWFLSGAHLEAYQARADLQTSYRIAIIVKTKTVTTIVEDC